MIHQLKEIHLNKSAVDGVISNRKIVQDYNQNERRKNNLSTVVKTKNNDLSLNFADININSKRMSPNQKGTRGDQSFIDDSSSIIYQNRY